MGETAGSVGLGVAVLGAGVIGAFHAATIARLDGLRLVAVADTAWPRATQVASRHGARALSGLEEALEDPAVEAVAVCTPSGLHADAVVSALEAGRHVVVEKPLDVTPEAVQRVLAAARSSDRVVTVISQHRFDASSVALRHAASTGRLGRITSAVVSMPWWRTQTYYDSGEWRGTWSLDGGGALMNQAIHSLDLLVWFLGRPVQVHARTATLAHAGIEVEDTAVATVVFDSGALGVVHATTAAYPGLGTRLQVHGDKGSAVIEGDRLVWFHASSAGDGPDYGNTEAANQATEALASVLNPGGPAAETSAPEAAAPGAAADPRALSDAHTSQYRDFLEAVRTGRAPAVTVAEAARTLSLVWALYESARTGRTVEPAG